jgi:C4-dicarboxylate-specific signal transduction histidine kinase
MMADRSKEEPLFGPTPPWWRAGWRPVTGFAVAAVAWTLLAWLATGVLQGRAMDAYLRQERSAAEHDLQLMTLGLSQNWEVAVGVLGGLARQPPVLAALRGGESGRLPAGGETPLTAVGRSFYSVVGDLKLIRNVFLLDKSGVGIAASNAMLSPSSPIGTSYADRGYYLGAIHGTPSSGFAYGRTTNQPGLYLSVPVQVDGAILGVLAAKLDASTLAPWFDSGEYFLADEHGVIMLTQDGEFLFTLLPGATVERLSLTDRMSLYKRSSFVNLLRDATALPGHDDVVTLRDRAAPVLLVTKALPQINAVSGLLRPLPQLSRLRQQRGRDCALAVGAGLLLLAAVAQLLWLRVAAERRHRLAEEQLAFRQTAFDAATMAIAIFDAEGGCLVANDAMGRLLRREPAATAGHNFRDDDLWQESGLASAASQVMELGGSQRGRWRLAPSFGQEIWVEASMKRFCFRAANFLLVVFTDVTDQHWHDAQAATDKKL